MAEYFDILDEQGNKTGKTKLRSLVHKDGDRHRTVHIWIINSGNEILLQKRSANKDSHPNMWDISSAGHISAGDESLPSAVRELEEELGISVREDDLEHLFTQKTSGKYGDFIDNEVSDVYLLKMDLDISKLKLQVEEVAEAKFIPIPELKNRIANKDKNMVEHDEEYLRLFQILRV